VELHTGAVYVAGENLPERVTIRILKSKLDVYPKFKELVTKKIGSDICFVTVQLWEAFLQAFEKMPDAENQQKYEIKFLRQNVQINIGSTVYYQPKKARRYPNHDLITTEKNLYFQEVFKDFHTLKDIQKKQILDQLVKEGIVPDPQIVAAKKIRKPRKKRATHPRVSTGKRKKRKGFFIKLWEYSMTIVTAIWELLFGKGE